MYKRQLHGPIGKVKDEKLLNTFYQKVEIDLPTIEHGRKKKKPYEAHQERVVTPSVLQQQPLVIPLIASGDSLGVITLWSSSGVIDRIFRGHSTAVRSISFASRDATRLVSGSQDGILIVWNIASGLAIHRCINH